jgi:hypothetical protein
MSSHLLPESLGDELEKFINSFWWGLNNSSGTGIDWLRWEKLDMRKEYVGMSFTPNLCTTSIWRSSISKVGNYNKP